MVFLKRLQHRGVKCPRAVEEIRDRTEREKQRAVFFIRLLTRLIFCWFLQEKGLIPRDLFRRRVSEQMLKDFSPRAGTYYRAFLQNLFFATLNQEQDKRMWRKKYAGNRDGHRGITNLYRYQELVTDDNAFLPLLKEKIPFVNGGLFDCLDDVFTSDEKAARKKMGQPSEDVRLDDFSEEKDNELCLPNELFFGEERDIDLSDIYEDQRRKKEKVRGLIEILSRYKFTVEENTPLEQDIALDPELLGKVFENLLASYNEDTRTTARKALGAFYTPREVVSYMVDEVLMAYLLSALEATIPKLASPLEPRLRQLFSSHPEHFQNQFTPAETNALIATIDRINILDPACGSGAFPMGALHRLVDLLQKLDPNNRHWKEQQLAKARRDRKLAEKMEDEENKQNTLREVESRIADIERSFDSRFHALDFARKLYLIENCIYGVDIQPIACQIAKLRFFIALIVDQHVDENEKNLGVRPLPNLETKIVAADSLIPIERRLTQGDMLTENVADVKKLRICAVAWKRYGTLTSMPAPRNPSASAATATPNYARKSQWCWNAPASKARWPRRWPRGIPTTRTTQRPFSTPNGCSACRWARCASRLNHRPRCSTVSCSSTKRADKWKSRIIREERLRADLISSSPILHM